MAYFYGEPDGFFKVDKCEDAPSIKPNMIDALDFVSASTQPITEEEGVTQSQKNNEVLYDIPEDIRVELKVVKSAVEDVPIVQIAPVVPGSTLGRSLTRPDFPQKSRKTVRFAPETKVFGKVYRITPKRVYVVFCDGIGRKQPVYGSFFNSPMKDMEIGEEVAIDLKYLSSREYTGDDVWISAIITSLVIKK